jgi:peptidoglycan/LPS O-acetylase OafA/YrhL
MQIETRIRPPELNGRAPTEERVERRTAYLYGGLALASIWLAVVFTSIFAPDMVTGTTQDHFPVAVVVALLAGLAATRSLVRAFTRGIGGTSHWALYAVVMGAIWSAVALVSIYAPVTVAGTDPTRVPIAAIVAPIAGAILTGAVTEVFSASRR